eukprot:GHRR01027069.1.p1 GENE.GHRR01027069.1~~GHRR01027069.1.p1  ORF type:complete len:184 (+),score=78.24 GHRR01027069.1:189-740(+)
MGIDANPVLRFEVPLLQGLQFDLVVHSPYRALAGLFKEFDELRSQQSSELDQPLLSAPSQVLSTAHAKARSSLDILVMTDVPLLYPPGLIAVAAMRSGFRRVQLACHKFLQHIAQKAVQAANGTVGDAEQQLLASLSALDALAAEQGLIEEAALQLKAAEVDRRIKLWKKGISQKADNRGQAA